mgnify:CR=1 FL=1
MAVTMLLRILSCTIIMAGMMLKLLRSVHDSIFCFFFFKIILEVVCIMKFDPYDNSILYNSFRKLLAVSIRFLELLFTIFIIIFWFRPFMSLSFDFRLYGVGRFPNSS